MAFLSFPALHGNRGAIAGTVLNGAKTDSQEIIHPA
jgi:hypothetical protein